YANHG
ncbi:hypothetical protein DB1_23410, partial [Bacillus anthracis]